MSTRRAAREWAVQILFQMDFNPQEPKEAFEQFWAEKEDASPKAREFVEELVRGALSNLPQIDAMLQKCADNWDLKRLAAVDRNILRVAIYEMLFRDDIPPVVSIDEAVDIAKDFSDTASGKFVNGILDRVRKELTRPARTPSRANDKS